MLRLSPIGWALRPLKNYANFSGRASRAEFWWYSLVFLVIYILLLFAGAMLSAGAVSSVTSPFHAGMGVFGVAILVFWLGLLVPSLAVSVRRLHDTDHSGWWLWAYAIIYVVYFVSLMSLGALEGSVNRPTLEVFVLVLSLAFLAYAVALFVFYCLPGTPGPNRFGGDPYGVDVHDVFS